MAFSFRELFELLLLTMSSNKRTVTNIRVDRALIDGFIPSRAMEWMTMDRFETPAPVVK